MSRFFFHLTGSQPVRDFGGEDFATVEDVISHAKVVAAELAKNSTMPGSLLVQDRRGRVIFEASLEGYREDDSVRLEISRSLKRRNPSIN